jgi:hypothetical protein
VIVDQVPHRPQCPKFGPPNIQQHLPCGAVAFAEALYIADGPATHRALAGHAGVSADGPQAFAFGHSGADGFRDFFGVIRKRHYCYCFSRASLRECT